MAIHLIDKKILHTFIPVNALNAPQQDALLAVHEAEVLTKGQTLFSVGESDNKTVYLLSGEVELTDRDNNKKIIAAGSIESSHPLDNHQPRESTAITLTDVNILRLDSFRLDTLLSWDQSVGYTILDISSNRAMDDDAEWMIKLLNSKSFEKIPPSNIQHIFKRLKPIVYKAGDIVIKQGDVGNCCYFVKQGLVEVTRKEAGETSPRSLAVLEVGSCFGEDALLTESVRNATVTMVTDGILMRLDKTGFFQLLKKPMVKKISFKNALKLVNESHGQWIDVRLQEEYDLLHIKRSMNMPFSLLRLKAKLLDKHSPYIIYCDTGRRSAAASYLLSQSGFDAYLLEGGINGLSSRNKTELVSKIS